MKSKICAIFLSAILLIACGPKKSVDKSNESASSNKKTYKELYKQEEQVLTTYAVVDSVKHIYRIPVSLAIKLLASENQQ